MKGAAEPVEAPDFGGLAGGTVSERLVPIGIVVAVHPLAKVLVERR